MSVDPRFERSVLAELALGERRARGKDRSRDAGSPAESLDGADHEDRLEGAPPQPRGPGSASAPPRSAPEEMSR